MPQYLTPGVYVEEMPVGARPIEGVGTCVAAFVGALDDSEAPMGIPTVVDNWTQYTNLFASEGPSSALTLAVHGFFLNGGQRCYVLNVGEGGSLTGTPSHPGLSAFEHIDEITIVAAPGFTDAASYDAVLSHCERMKDRVAVLDASATVADLNDLTKPATASSSSSHSSGSPASTGGEAEAESDAEAGGESSSAASSSHSSQRSSTGGAAPRQSEWGAVYFPWIKVVDPLTDRVVDAPPSGHVAGVWARTYGNRGVRKAPANETLRGALDITQALTPSEQGLLNSAGVNAIRSIKGSI
ncbi:phage tail sheath subtilisin-like domain-containing protein [Microbacterium sp. P5_E9]